MANPRAIKKAVQAARRNKVPYGQTKKQMGPWPVTNKEYGPHPKQMGPFPVADSPVGPFPVGPKQMGPQPKPMGPFPVDPKQSGPFPIIRKAMGPFAEQKPKQMGPFPLENRPVGPFPVSDKPMGPVPKAMGPFPVAKGEMGPRTAERHKNTQNKRTGNDALLNAVDPKDGMFGAAFGTLGTMGRSAVGNLSQKGNLKKAGIGVVQSSAASAGVHGGLAALQGEDPWEAAKTGAIRGAMIGGGYQGLKAATHSNKGSIWGNVKNMSATTQQTYRAHTTAGNTAMRQEKVSGSLKKVLLTNKMVKENKRVTKTR